MLVIDPEECIDCGACEPECPVEAIFPEDALPEKGSHFSGRASSGKIASTGHSASHAPQFRVYLPPAKVESCLVGATAQYVSSASRSCASTRITRQKTSRVAR